MTDLMDDFDTDINIDEGISAMLVAVVAIVTVICVLAVCVAGILVWAVLK